MAETCSIRTSAATIADMTEDARSSIQRRAREIGFDLIGFAAVDDEHARIEHGRYLAWLDAGRGATMSYLRRGAAKRESVRQILPAAASVVVVARSYAHRQPPPQPGDGVISRYAGGRDYHKVMERDLRALTAHMRGLDANATHRWYVDTGPVLERAQAAAAGIAWIGKNTMAIHPQVGSYFFIGVVITTLALASDPPITDHCGSCTRCLDACPTGALDREYSLDSRKCIAYWNVEHRGPLPDEIASTLGAHVFGCDICQEVCPWNREDRVTAPLDEALAPRAEQASRDALAMTREFFALPAKLLDGSTMKRARRQGLLRNMATVLANLSRHEALDVLQEMSADADSVVAESARNALARLITAPPVGNPPRSQ